MGKQAKQHRKKYKPTDQAIQESVELISKPPLRRLARRGGAKRITTLAYKEMRGTVARSLKSIIEKTALVTKSSDQTTITIEDVLFVLNSHGSQTYQ